MHFTQPTASKLNVANNTAGLEEYVDILQVQQLLLDSTSSTLATSTAASSATTTNSSNTAANALNTARHRPRVNIQKATEYSSSMANASCASMLLQGKNREYIVKNTTYFVHWTHHLHVRQIVFNGENWKKNMKTLDFFAWNIRIVSDLTEKSHRISLVYSSYNPFFVSQPNWLHSITWN